MKKHSYLVMLFVVLTVSFVCVLLFSYRFLEQENKAPKENLRVSVILPTNKQEYWVEVSNGIEQACSDEISISFHFSENNVLSDQLESLEMAIAAQVDGIIVQVSDDIYFETALNRATAYGIPVVVIDGNAGENHYYVGSDNYQIGYLAGQAMANITNETANIAIITENENSFSQNERIDGFKAAINLFEEMSITSIEYTNPDIIEAAKVAEEVLKTHPETDALFGVTGISTSGIAKMIETKFNQTSYSVVGVDSTADTLKGLEQGYISETVVQQPNEIGKQAITILNQMLVEKNYQQSRYNYTPIQLVMELSSIENER